ncbi:MAG: hypothetical protein ACTJHC_00220 [Vagococcus sp.]
MGLFSNNQKIAASNIYEKEVKVNLHEKDGLTHVLMINSFSKWLNQNFGVDDKYTNQLNQIITNMQNDGYEIVDIKLNSIQGQGLSGQMEGFHTLITYK